MLLDKTPPPWQPKAINSISSNLPCSSAHPAPAQTLRLPANLADRSPPWQPHPPPHHHRQAIQSISNGARPPEAGPPTHENEMGNETEQVEHWPLRRGGVV